MARRPAPTRPTPAFCFQAARAASVASAFGRPALRRIRNGAPCLAPMVRQWRRAKRQLELALQLAKRRVSTRGWARGRWHCMPARRPEGGRRGETGGGEAVGGEAGGGEAVRRKAGGRGTSVAAAAARNRGETFASGLPVEGSAGFRLS